jgi:hypothetical protein
LPDVAIRNDVIRITEIEFVDVLLENELVDFEGALAVDGNGFKLFRVELNTRACSPHTHDHVILRHLIAGLGTNFAIPEQGGV